MKTPPGPYELEMGRRILKLAQLFRPKAVDHETADKTLQLLADPKRWPTGHQVFDVIRARALSAIESKDSLRIAQYAFEETCCQAVYNACQPSDPFDESSPFFVIPAAFEFASRVEIVVAEVVQAISTVHN